MLNYTKLMSHNPTSFGKMMNDKGQQIEFFEHPTRGDEYPIIAVLHETQQAGNTEFYHSLVLSGCKLKNQASTSLRIFKGYEKLRCAWIEFESYEVVAATDFKSSTHVQFNPRTAPTWRINGVEGQDNKTFNVLKTTGNQVYA